ncbi:A disintegrin and metalloproteinase with thrombospondin motifs 9, partial [Camelus dromedarius]
VASIYKDPSIGNLINIVIVNLVVIHNEQVIKFFSSFFYLFNMPHDDNNKCKEEGVKSPQHVMAPTLNFYTNPWMWSKCSRKYITEFLDTGYGECLLNEPESRPYPLPPQLPGLLYNVNKQCELIFGPGSQVCPYMMQCRRLWCNNVDGAHKGCRTQHTPWADGTECEPGKASSTLIRPSGLGQKWARFGL